jgi:hypothetical protein
MTIQDLHYLGAEPALRKVPAPFHEEHDVVRFDGFLDLLAGAFGDGHRGG